MLINIISSLLSIILLSNIVIKGVGFEVLNDNNIRIKPVITKALVLSLLSLVVFIIDYLIYRFLLIPFRLEYINLIILILLVIGINELYKLLLLNRFDSLKEDNYLGLNSILLIVGILNLGNLEIADAIMNIIGSLIGFVAISTLIVIIQSKIRISPVLKGFRGIPLILIILGIIALILNGLGGIF